MYVMMMADLCFLQPWCHVLVLQCKITYQQYALLIWRCGMIDMCVPANTARVPGPEHCHIGVHVRCSCVTLALVLVCDRAAAGRGKVTAAKLDGLTPATAVRRREQALAHH